MAQVQPVPCAVYGDAILSDMRMAAPRLTDFGDTEWSDYRRRVAEPNTRPDRPYGAYAVETRRRRKSTCPVTGAAA